MYEEIIRYYLKKAPEPKEAIIGFNIYNLLSDVSNRTRIPIEQMKARTRKGEVVKARFYYFTLCRHTTTATLKQIGSQVNKDHATVLHGEKTTRNTIQFVREFNNLFGDIMKVPVPAYFNREHSL